MNMETKNNAQNQLSKELLLRKKIKMTVPLAKLSRRKEKTQINTIRNFKGVTTDYNEVQRIIREYFQKLYFRKLEKLIQF